MMPTFQWEKKTPNTTTRPAEGVLEKERAEQHEGRVAQHSVQQGVGSHKVCLRPEGAPGPGHRSAGEGQSGTASCRRPSRRWVLVTLVYKRRGDWAEKKDLELYELHLFL